MKLNPDVNRQGIKPVSGTNSALARLGEAAGAADQNRFFLCVSTSLRLCVKSFNFSAWLFALLWLLALIAAPGSAQDGLDLPTELYILLNEGRVEQYGIGATGVQPVTGDETFILDFGIAPDNNWMAYRTEEGLFLSPISGDGEPVMLEGESADFPAMRGRGQTIAWSPDGNALAYTTSYGARVALNIGDATPVFADMVVEPLRSLSWSPLGTYLAAEAADDIWWVFKRQGTQMNLVAAIPGTRGTAWLSDVWLIFAPPAGGLRLMDLSSANMQTILQEEGNDYYLPAVQPDGTIVVFTRAKDDEITPASLVYWAHLAIEGAGVFETQRGENPVDLDGAQWSPNASLLIAFRDNTLSLVIPQTGQTFPLPIQNVVSHVWGAPHPPSATGASMSYDAYFLAPDDNGIVQIWRLPANATPPLALTAAESDIVEYRLPQEPDGDLVYVSDGQVWRQNLESGETQMLAELPDEATDISINHTGNTLAYTMPSTGEESPGGIWFASTEAAVQPQRVLANSGQTTTYNRPRFSAESDAMLAGLTVNNSPSTVMLDPDSGDVVMLGNYGAAQWGVDEQIIAYGGQMPGELYLIDPDTRPIQAILLMRTAGRIRDYARLGVDRMRVLVSAENPLGPSVISLLEVEIGGGEPDDIASAGFITRPVLSPDGDYVGGLTGIGGSPLVFDVESGTTVVIGGIIDAEDFRWADFIR